MRHVSRREFLKAAAIGSAATAAAVTMPSFVKEFVPSAHASSPGVVSFQFVGESGLPIVLGVDHRVTMSGEGKVDPSASQVTARGSFTQFDNSGPKDPKPILSSGTWTAERLSGFSILGTWGQGPFAAGEIQMNVTLHQDFPTQVEIPAVLKLVSNIEAGKLTTGQPEGVTLTIPGSIARPFVPLSKKKSKKKKAKKSQVAFTK